MARPRKSDDSRAQLIVAGTQMLIEQGYHGTGIKPVLDKVGVPKGSFYNFFASKEAFVACIIDEYGARERSDSGYDGDLAGLEDAPALVQLWCSFQHKVQRKLDNGESCGCLLGAMAAEIAQASDLCRESIARVEQRWLDGLTDLIELGQREGDFYPAPLAIESARLLYNSWQGALLQYQVSLCPNEALKNLYVLFSLLMTPKGLITFETTTFHHASLGETHACKRGVTA